MASITQFERRVVRNGTSTTLQLLIITRVNVFVVISSRLRDRLSTRSRSRSSTQLLVVVTYLLILTYLLTYLLTYTYLLILTILILTYLYLLTYTYLLILTNTYNTYLLILTYLLTYLLTYFSYSWAYLLTNVGKTQWEKSICIGFQ
jgi:hypothetical protein